MEEILLWPLAIYFAASLGIVTVMIGLSALLGQRHKEHATDEPYESGIKSFGGARARFDAKFYLVAMFFVVFDLEAVYLYAWSTSVVELGWLGYVEVLVFVGVLVATLAYLWKVGGLDFGPKGRNRTEVKG